MSASDAAYIPPQGRLSLEQKLMRNSDVRPGEPLAEPTWGEVREVMREASRYREALERVYQIGRGPHVVIAREALDRG